MSWIDWGTAPAWFGAFFTSLGVLVAVFIYWRDSRQTRFAQAHQIRVEVIEVPDASEDDWPQFRVRVVNQSDKSIFQVKGTVAVVPLESVGIRLDLVQLNNKRALTDAELARRLKGWLDFKNEAIDAPDGGWIRPGHSYTFDFANFLGPFGTARVVFEDALGEVWVCHSGNRDHSFESRRRLTKRSMLRTRLRLERQQRMAGDRDYTVRNYFEHRKRLKQWVKEHENDRESVDAVQDSSDVHK
jgi:hypothetical protein